MLQLFSVDPIALDQEMAPKTSRMDVGARDGTDQHFCSPARQELIRNRPAQPVYSKLQLIFWPGAARGP